MFEKELKDRLGRIFQLKRVTFDLPSEDREQEVLFIKVDRSASSIRFEEAIFRVYGSFSVFANSEKMPFGYINKKIRAAHPQDITDFFFYDIDENEKYFGNLVERRCSFIFLYKTEYDPESGEISQVNFVSTEG
jgi:hypothetical protein